MLITKIVRGNLIEFNATFLDVDAEPVEPASAEVTLSYIDASGTRDTETVEMDANTDGSFAGIWDSSVAKKGRVHWAVRATDPSAAEEGFFDLSANLANPDPDVVTA